MSATIDVLNPDRPKRVLIVASNPGPEGRVTGSPGRSARVDVPRCGDQRVRCRCRWRERTVAVGQ